MRDDMKANHKKLLGYFTAMILGLALCGIIPWMTGHTMSPERARLVGDSGPHASGRVTAAGSLLSREDPDLAILKAKNLASGRSPAYESDAVMEADFATLSKEFLARDSLAAGDEKLKEFFPDGKGVNHALRLTLLLSSRGTDNPDAFSEIQLANRVQAEILAHGESAVVSLTSGLTVLPAEMMGERHTVIRLLSMIGSQHPELRDEVKSSLLAEAGRSGKTAAGALALTALLRVNSSKEWSKEVNYSYERLHPGSDLSEVVALNVVAL